VHEDNYLVWQYMAQTNFHAVTENNHLAIMCTGSRRHSIDEFSAITVWCISLHWCVGFSLFSHMFFEQLVRRVSFHRRLSLHSLQNTKGHKGHEGNEEDKEDSSTSHTQENMKAME
jgi:hypothetical protein